MFSMSKQKPQALIDAIANGAVKYFTGKPCIHGHVADRYVSSNACVICTSEMNAQQTTSKGIEWRKSIRANYLARMTDEQRRERQRRKRKLPKPTRPDPGLCECCWKPCKLYKTHLALDHCHKTNAFRGWLCNDCNLALGRLGDDEAGVLRLLDYVRRTSQGQLITDA